DIINPTDRDALVLERVEVFDGLADRGRTDLTQHTLFDPVDRPGGVADGVIELTEAGGSGIRVISRDTIIAATISGWARLLPDCGQRHPPCQYRPGSPRRVRRRRRPRCREAPPLPVRYDPRAARGRHRTAATHRPTGSHGHRPVPQ